MKVYLFGAGREGKKALSYIGGVEGFIDNNLFGQSVLGLPVFALNEIDNTEETLIVITTSKYEKDISRQLLENGFRHFVSFKKPLISTDQRLDEEGWGEIYNESMLEDVVNYVKNNKYNSWTKEMLNISRPGQKILEIGCGSGQTSLVLASKGRIDTALDYATRSLNLVRRAADRLQVQIDTQCSDACKPLPFAENSFDIIFQAGLLEHFTTKEQVSMLSSWKKYGKQMVSFVPNANSIAYHFGKKMMEKDGTWEYGKEVPLTSMIREFSAAGISVSDEYTIGFEEALTFLPQNHYLRMALEKMAERVNPLEFGQGYLLVTIGDC